MNCRIEHISIRDKDNLELYEMVQEIGEKENGFDNPFYGLNHDDYCNQIEKCIKDSMLVNVKPGRVPQSIYWLYDGDYPIGFSKMRHFLVDALRIRGGHIGYGIRNSKRGLGYGTILLHLTLGEISNLGVCKVLITCDVENYGSRNVIEKNGGILAEVADSHCSYWINVALPNTNFGNIQAMSSYEYDYLKQQIIEELTETLVSTKQMTRSDASIAAMAEQDQVLPHGVKTKNHNLRTLKSETGEILGYAWFGRVVRAYGDVAFLFDINVLPQYRNRGCGKALLKAIEQEAFSSGYSTIELYVSAKNIIAMKLYDAFGYQKIRGNDEGSVLSKQLV